LLGRLRGAAGGAVLLALIFFGGLALSPQDIVLVVNQNSPDSIRLAKVYAQARGIPDGRAIGLNLPVAEELNFDVYERFVVPPIRQFLREQHLRDQIKCLVTFYGVPFRIRAKTDNDAEKAELADLEDQLRGVLGNLEINISQEEDFARSLDPTFVRPPRSSSQTAATEMALRHIAAVNAAGAKINAIADLDLRRQYLHKLNEFIIQNGGAGEMLQRLGPSALTSAKSSPEQKQRWLDIRARVIAAADELDHEEERRYDSDARALVRELTAQTFGTLKLAQVLESQIDYLRPGTTNAALDNELALLWFNYYPRNGFLPNPLNFHNAARIPPAAMMMVSRLDGPDPLTVEKMIATSIRVERDGLQGGVAINSYGHPDHGQVDGRNRYREFDQTLRDLAQVVRTRTTLPLHEEFGHLFQHREVKDVALYCGWYSLRHYVPGMEFAPGAVGYHVASLEMVGLHESYETGWVRGLTSDGVVATLGPVAEPYLLAFPPPNEFFPLLMTGKLSLAEVYWRTEPTTSWMMCLIGDPLYTPYRTHPALEVEDLPPGLSAALDTRMERPISNSSGKPQ
jgi:uncharacterized protein (TIGR03790 family)